MTLPLRDVYVIARNAAGRACLQHKLVDGQASVTKCGRDVSTWSRSFMPRAAGRDPVSLTGVPVVTALEFLAVLSAAGAILSVWFALVARRR